MCFAYNCDLYYRDYFPDYDLGWWLFAVTIVIGSIGVVVGGVISDKFVAKMGIRSRVAVLAISQIIATPFAFGSVYFNPLWAIITLGISYFFGKFTLLYNFNIFKCYHRNDSISKIIKILTIFLNEILICITTKIDISLTRISY